MSRTFYYEKLFLNSIHYYINYSKFYPYLEKRIQLLSILFYYLIKNNFQKLMSSIYYFSDEKFYNYVEWIEYIIKHIYAIFSLYNY